MGNLSFTSSPSMSDLSMSDGGDSDRAGLQGAVVQSSATVKIEFIAFQSAPIRLQKTIALQQYAWSS